MVPYSLFFIGAKNVLKHLWTGCSHKSKHNFWVRLPTTGKNYTQKKKRRRKRDYL